MQQHTERGGLLDRYFAHGVAGEVTAQFFEDLSVDLTQHHSAVYLAATQQRQALQSAPAILVVGREHRERHEHLIGVQAWIATSQIGYLCLLYRLYHALRDQFHSVVDASEMLGDIQQERGTTAQERTGL